MVSTQGSLPMSLDPKNPLPTTNRLLSWPKKEEEEEGTPRLLLRLKCSSRWQLSWAPRSPFRHREGNDDDDDAS